MYHLLRLPVLVLTAYISFSGIVPAKAENAATKSTQSPASSPLVIDGREAEELWINTRQGRFRFTAEIADDDSERSSGLMFRQSMPPTHGMLFDFQETRQVIMWMRNTPLPLDMIFVDKSGRVVRIAERTTPFSDATIDSGEPVSFVLEINAGVSRLIGLKAGDHLEHRVFTKE